MESLTGNHEGVPLREVEANEDAEAVAASALEPMETAAPGPDYKTTTDSSHDESEETEEEEDDDNNTECTNLEGTTFTVRIADVGEGRGDGHEEPRGSRKEPVVPQHHEEFTTAVSASEKKVSLADGMPSAVQFEETLSKSSAKSKPTRITDMGKIYSISNIKHRGSFSQSHSSSGPGAYSVQTATATTGESLSVTDQDTEGQRRQPQSRAEEDPPLRFWRDESTASGASATSPSRHSLLLEATLVNDTINNLYPPVSVNSYGRPRQLSSSQRQHRRSYCQHPKLIESDKDSGDSIAEAQALSSNGVVLFCLKSRTGRRLVLGALAVFVFVIVGLILGLTGEKNDATKQGGSPVHNMTVNDTTVIPTEAPSVSPSFAPTQAPTRPFGAAVLPQALQNSLRDPTSPQSAAMEWIMEDPQLNEIPLERKLQRYAMVVFYFSLDGDNWADSSNWLEYNSSECDWFSDLQEGRKPCNAASELTHLVLPANDLKGSLPAELELLSNTQRIILADNHLLGGPIPSSLWQGQLATTLRSLDLSHTGLTGSLPADALASWSRLSSLQLESVSFMTGGLPTQVGLLLSLRDMTLSSTHLSGSLPSQFGLLSRLTSLKMRQSHINGMLPTEAGQLSSLEYLDLGENSMSGTIPSQIGLLTSLELIALDNSFLTGSIPNEVGLMKRLNTFNVFGNHLSSSIPTELMQASGLEYLFLNQNRLTGTLPTEIGKLSKLLWLVAWDNRFTGTIPSALQSNTALTLLSLATNPLTGTIPTELFSVTSLEWLFLGWSSLSGTIGTEVGLLSNHLQGLYLNAANLTGTLPTEVGLLNHLTDLWIDSQVAGLTGTLPSELGNLKFLSEFQANDNRLNGSLPLDFGSLSSIDTLNLARNEFSGQVLPNIFGNMKQLSVIDLQDNFFTGLLPGEELADLPFLKELHLNNNSFSGQLPDELCDLNVLVFDCSEILCGCQCSCQTD